MRLISRSKPRQVDEHLTYFTQTEANEFRRLVGQSFVAAGRDVAVYPDHVVDRSGTIVERSALLGNAPLKQRLRFLLEMPIANLFDFLL